MTITTECLAKVALDAWAFETGVPYKDMTPELCVVAVKKLGWALALVPSENKTPELCLLAVKHHGWALKQVPEDLRTPEICLAAISQNPRAIQYSPYSALELMSMK